MSWFGKVLGGAIGAAFGGPVGGAVGVGIGHYFDAQSEAGSPAPVGLGRLVWETDMASGGPGLVFKVSTQFHRSVQGAHVMAWLKDGEQRINSRANSYANDVGNLILRGALLEDGDGIVGLIFLPYSVLPLATPSALRCEIIVVDGLGQIVGANFWDVQIPPRGSRHGAPLAGFALSAISLMQALGGFSKPEIDASFNLLVDLFDLDDAGQLALSEMFQEMVQYEIPMSVPLQVVTQMPAGGQQQAFVYVVATALADGPLNERERGFVIHFAEDLDLPNELLTEFGLSTASDAEHFALLELQDGATWAQVKTAYRRLASDYHPDRVAQMPGGYQRFAHEKMSAINQAYEALRQKFGQ
jgi:DnaJ like chaperone protein